MTEVNPLALTWLLARYRVRVVYVVRHPGAVAASFDLGWRGGQFARRFPKELLAGLAHEQFTTSFWAQMGALLAVVYDHVLRNRGKGVIRVVRYEVTSAPIP